MSTDEFMPVPDNEALSEVRAMAEEVILLRETISALTQRIKELGAEERKLSQHDLPEKMREIGLTDFTLEDGGKVSIKHKVKASLAAKRKEEGLAWLRDNGFGDLIKARIVEEGVHHSTLTAFCKEQLAMGKPLPTSLFGVYEYDETEIK